VPVEAPAAGAEPTRQAVDGDAGDPALGDRVQRRAGPVVRGQQVLAQTPRHVPTLLYGVRTVLYGSRTERLGKALMTDATDVTDTTDLAAARRLYDALAAHDARGLLGALHPPSAASWRRACRSASEAPGTGPRRCSRAAGPRSSPPRTSRRSRRVPARGRGPHGGLGATAGTPAATGRPLDAAFAHVLRSRRRPRRELVQITDTARWHDALRP
jgi:hypothetical protein